MKYLLYLFFLLFVSFAAVAQSPEIKLDWLVNTPLYNNGGIMDVSDIAIDNDGSMVTVGYFFGTVDFDPGQDTFDVHSASSAGDIFIAKYTKAGKLVFAYHFGDKNNTEAQSAYGVAIDDVGNIYITGNFNKTIDFDPGNGTALLTAGASTEVFIASYSKNGLFRYAVKVTETAGILKNQTGRSIAVDKEHNAYITGSFEDKPFFNPDNEKVQFFSAGLWDIFFAKYDKNGNYLWAKSIGGKARDEASSIALDNKGNIVLCGQFSSKTVDFDPGASSAVLFNHGMVAIDDIFFAKYDNNGTYLFAKGIGGTNNDEAKALAIGTDNSIAITGYFYGDNVDFNPGGKPFILSSFKYKDDSFIAKYDETGNILIAFGIGGGDYIKGNDIGLDSAGNIYTIGDFKGDKVDFDPGPGIRNIPTQNLHDNYLAKYSTDGALIFAGAIGNEAVGLTGYLANVRSLAVGKRGNSVIGGIYSGLLDIDPNKTKVFLSQGNYTLFAARYTSDGDYVSSFDVDTYPAFYGSFITVNASATDEDGNVYICGVFQGQYDFDPGPALYVMSSLKNYYQSAFFAKYNKEGNLLLAGSMVSNGNTQFYDIDADTEQNIYLAGTGDGHTDFDPSPDVHYWNNNKTSTDTRGHCFVKYNKSGQYIFAKGFPTASASDFEGNGIAIDKNKNIYVAGLFASTVDFDPGSSSHPLTAIGEQDMFYSKYDSAGNYIFAYNIGGKKGFNSATKLKLNSKGDIIICGRLSGSQVDFDPGPAKRILSSGEGNYQAGYIATYTKDGNFLSAFPLIALSDYHINMFSLSVDSQDDVYIAGNFAGHVDFMPGKDSFYLSAAEGLYFASYNPQGRLRYAKGLSANGYNDYLNCIAVDKNKNLFITGSFMSKKIDFDPGQKSSFLYSLGNSKVFLGKYDSLGNWVYSYDLEEDSIIGDSNAQTISLDTDGNIFYAGYFTSKIDFDLGPDTVYTHPTAQNTNLFLAKYLPVTINSERETLYRTVNSRTKANLNKESNLSVYPNPVSGHIVITVNNIKEPSGTAQALVYNATGSCVLKKELAISNHSIHSVIYVSALPKGAYFVTITAGDEPYKASFVVQ